ncbi:hypothetical protein FQA39_LY09283 [Lamprigera yunnana]|nr:hypothetical protein FQA39_LY09283 [Lamprigera yunnana]
MDRLVKGTMKHFRTHSRLDQTQEKCNMMTRSLKFSNSRERTQKRSLPNIPDPDKNEYLEPNVIHILEISKSNPRHGVSPTLPNSPSKSRPRQLEHSAIDDTKNYLNLPQTVRVK